MTLWKPSVDSERKQKPPGFIDQTKILLNNAFQIVGIAESMVTLYLFFLAFNMELIIMHFPILRMALPWCKESIHFVEISGSYWPE